MKRAPPPPSCELCNGEAAVYCPRDFASLCWSCDAKVHGANFIVARHVRHAICSKCKGFTGVRLSGVCLRRPPNICSLCTSDQLQYSLSSSAHSTNFDDGEVTSRQSKRARSSRRWRPWLDAEGIFVNWCSRLGLPREVEGEAGVNARNALSFCRDYLTALPFRVCLAASLWFGFKTSACHLLQRLEQISGVPAKLISAAESKLESLFRLSTTNTNPMHQNTTHTFLPTQLEEGWAEC